MAFWDWFWSKFGYVNYTKPLLEDQETAHYEGANFSNVPRDSAFLCIEDILAEFSDYTANHYVSDSGPDYGRQEEIFIFNGNKELLVDLLFDFELDYVPVMRRRTALVNLYLSDSRYLGDDSEDVGSCFQRTSEALHFKNSADQIRDDFLRIRDDPFSGRRPDASKSLLNAFNEPATLRSDEYFSPYSRKIRSFEDYFRATRYDYGVVLLLERFAREELLKQRKL